MNPSPPVVLAVGGLDPSGNAGILRDFIAISENAARPACAATCLTAQGPAGVRGVFPVAEQTLRAQVLAVLDDLEPAVVKVGLVPSANLVRTLRAVLRERALRIPVVVDPVTWASDGSLLLVDAPERWKEEILQLGEVICPNAIELGFLSGVEVVSPADALEAARLLLGNGPGERAAAVVVKGGHLRGDSCADILVRRDRGPEVLLVPREHGVHLRGTGCRHSSALAAHLARGYDLVGAAQRAQAYVVDQMRSQPSLGCTPTTRTSSR